MNNKEHGISESEFLSSVFAMALPVLAIVLLGAKNVGNGFERSEGTLWILGLSFVLSILGIVCGSKGRKDAFTRLATIAGLGTALLSGYLLIALK